MSELRKKISIDSNSSEAINGIFGEAIAEERLDDITVDFQYNYFDEQFDVRPEIVTGDGVTTVVDALATVSSATTGTAYRNSKDTIHYSAAHTGYAYLTALFDGVGIGRVGCVDGQDGFVLQVSNGNASFGYVKSGVDMGSLGALGLDDQTDWNGNYNISNIDLTKENIYFITYGYLGVANPTLWVKKDNWYILHTVKTEGVLDGTHVDSPVFPISIYAENGMIVKSGSWAGGTIGHKPLPVKGFTFPNILITGTGAIVQGETAIAANTTETIVIFHSKSLFHGKNNHKKALLSAYTFHLDIPSGTQIGVVVFQLVGVQTLSGVPTYTDINTASSIIEYDHDDTTGTGASVDVTAGSPSITRYLEYAAANKGANAADAEVDALAIGAAAYAGDTFAIVAKNIGAVSVVARVSMNWEEI